MFCIYVLVTLSNMTCTAVSLLDIAVVIKVRPTIVMIAEASSRIIILIFSITVIFWYYFPMNNDNIQKRVMVNNVINNS